MVTSIVQLIPCPQNPPWKLWSEFLFSLNMNNILLCVCKHVGTYKHTQKHMHIHTQAQEHTHRQKDTCAHTQTCMRTNTHTHFTTTFSFSSVYLLIGTHECFHATTAYVLLHIIFQFWNFALKSFGYKVKIKLDISIITLLSIVWDNVILFYAMTIPVYISTNSEHVCVL